MSRAQLRLATRGSALALAQTELAAAALRAAHPGLETEIVTISTQGDRDKSTPLRLIGGQGVFAAGVRIALLDGEAELAMHSLKDVPTTPVDGLVIAAVLERADPRDAFIGAGGRRLADLPAGARVGTSSTRRIAALRALRPDVEVVDIRGNIDTRLAALRRGDYDGIVLAAAGLARLGVLDVASEVFDPGVFAPAPGQGAIALECRADDAETIALLAAIDHADTRAAITAERGVLAALGSGCSLAVGAYAERDGDLISVRAMLGGEEPGTRPATGNATGPIADAEALGRGLGERLRELYARSTSGNAGVPERGS